MARVGVLINPNAGGNAALAARRAAFERAVGSDGAVLVPERLGDLPAAAAELSRRGIDILAVCGGDGSFFRALSAFLVDHPPATLPKFLPLPAGSMNTIAKSLGWRGGDLTERLRRVARSRDVAADFRVVEREVMCINHRHYGFMVGAGVIVNFLAAYYAEAGRGPIAAARLAARFVASVAGGGDLARTLFASFDGELIADGGCLASPRYNVVYAATVSQLGLGFRVAYRAGTEPGRFHLIAGEPALGRLIWRLPHARFGWPMAVAGLEDRLAAEVALRFAQPTRFMIDGDILEPVAALQIGIGPRLAIIV